MTSSTNFAPLLERFFLQRLMQQRQASPHTISSYRDTFCRLLAFIKQRLHKSPPQLHFEGILAPLIGKFLDTLNEHDCITVRTLNFRLTHIPPFLPSAT